MVIRSGEWWKLPRGVRGNWRDQVRWFALAFGSGMIQTALGSLNILAISHRRFGVALGVTLAFHLVWTVNVRAVLISWVHRVAFAVGATCGVALGLSTWGRFS